MIERKRIHSFDALKAIAAFFVCYQHACGSGYLSEYCLAIAKTAVPIFIMLTGYMYKDTKARGHQKSQIRRFFSIAIQMTLLWFLLDSIYHCFKHDINNYWHQLINISNIKHFLMFNDPIIADHAWYMWALIYVLVLALFIPTMVSNKAIQIIIILIGTSLLLLLGRYSFILGRDFPYYYIRNFACVGLPYFLIGIRIRQHNDDKLLPGLRTSIFFVLICIVLQFAEHYLLLMVNSGGKSGSYVMTPALSVAFFILFCSLQDIIKGTNLLSIIGRKYSLFIYVIHPVFVRVEQKVFTMDSIWQYFGFVFVVLASLLLAILYSKTLKKTKVFHNVF